MRWKVLLVLSIYLVGMMPAVLAEEGQSDVLNVKYLMLRVGIEKRLVAMDTTINFAQDKGIDTKKLEKQRDDFVDEYNKLEDAAKEGDNKKFKKALESLKDADRKFIEEVREDEELMSYGKELREEIKKALEDNQDYFDQLEDEAYNALEDLMMEKIDQMISKAQDFIDKAKDQDLDTEELEEILSEVETKKVELKDAIDAKNVKEIREVSKEINDLFKEFRDVAKGLREDILAERLEKILNKSKNIIERSENVLDELEEDGTNVQDLRNSLDKVKDHVNSAENYYEQENYEGTIEELRDARKDFKKFVDKLRDVLSKRGGSEK